MPHRAGGVAAASRAIGSCQLIPGLEGTRFWAEYYLPGFGRVPDNVTIAGGAEWTRDATDAERHRYKANYASSLDPYR